MTDLTQEIIDQNIELKNELNILNKTGVALMAEKDIDRLLDLILINAREITQADSGSIYIVERNEKRNLVNKNNISANKNKLKFMLTQSDTIVTSFKRHILDIDKNSIAGYVALTQNVLNIKDVYDLPLKSQFGFNKEIDNNTGYHTKSMLVVPMSNQDNEIIGVLQLINKKKNKGVVLNSLDMAKREIVPFEKRDINLVSSLAGQAAVSLENSLLYAEIQQLFKGFVKAAITAIEARDPTTFGHSERVAILTTIFAETVSKTTTGIYSDVHFNENQMMEIEYASLLHDFGKVGVRENVLVKSHKLYDIDLERIKNRFELIKMTYKAESYKKRLEFLLENEKEEYLTRNSAFDNELEQMINKVDSYFTLICEANKPVKIHKELSETISSLRNISFKKSQDNNESFITKEEENYLTISEGTLNELERQEIESHVTHTYNFLQNIPWTIHMENIPNIAYGHHEMLDGSGYPRKIMGDEISIQSRMIAISDIYDALTAHDRPYKKALPKEITLKILKKSASEKKIDKDLLDIFINSKVYDSV